MPHLAHSTAIWTLKPQPPEFAPDLVIISAGFDAAEGDPIGGCHLTPEVYGHMAAQLQV